MASIHSVPNEILSAIFTEGALAPILPPVSHTSTGSLRWMLRQFTSCGSWDPNTFSPSVFAAAVSLVSRLWRDIALATPALWSKIVFRDRDFGFEVSRILYSRVQSSSYPVDLFLAITDWDIVDEERAMEIIVPAMAHSRSLVVHCRGRYADPMILDVLQTCGHAPLLEHLDLGGIIATRECTLFSGHPLPRLRTFRSLFPSRNVVCTLLGQAAPSLHALEFSGAFAFRPGLSLPSLCAVAFDSPDDGSAQDIPGFLEYVHLPALRSVGMFAEVSALFDLSAATHPRAVQVMAGLTAFMMDILPDGVDDTQAAGVYALLPNVRVVEFGPRRPPNSFVTALATRPGAASGTHTAMVCPKLEHLIIFGFFARGDPLLDDVIRVVVSRKEADIPLKKVSSHIPLSVAQKEELRKWDVHVVVE